MLRDVKPPGASLRRAIMHAAIALLVMGGVIYLIYVAAVVLAMSEFGS